jgi:hypothetical protein
MLPPAAMSKAGETMALMDPADRAPRLYKIDFRFSMGRATRDRG